MTFSTPYEELLNDIMATGQDRPDRTGVGTRGVFGAQMRFDLRRGFPLITSKKVHTKSLVHELLWFLEGNTNVQKLQESGVKIWDQWAAPDGELGPIYGHQWRSWNSDPDWGDDPRNGAIDQIADVIEGIKADPFGRRHIVTAWNPSDLPMQKLPPCHVMFQFHVNADGELSCQLYQRSADMFLGVPFNIASYALLTHMVAAQTGYRVAEFIWTGGDVHIYRNHFDQVQELLKRDTIPLPTLRLADRPSIDHYQPGDIEWVGYNPHPAIKAPVAV